MLGLSMKLLIATRNRHKLQEIKQLFDLPDMEIISAFDFPEIPDVVEDGKTFEANAIKKATTLAIATKHWALSDDSGLEVNALGGAPGVYSARYAGEPSDTVANNRKLLQELEGKADRSAQFRCVIALSEPSGRAQYVEGTCTGHIVEEERGTNGFGYDPLFVPTGYTETFAELSSEEKNQLSHRGRALALALEKWGPLLSGQHE